VADEFWFWAGADGSLKTVDQRELESALNRGAIPPRAFVWRQGWGEWLRAAEVKELSHAVPATDRVASVTPKLSPDATHPPPIPKEFGRTLMLDPIIPVASTPENDKPGTQLMVDVELELDDADLKPVTPEPAPSRRTPPPPRRSSAPPPPSMRPPRPGATPQPIVPMASGPLNDTPNTDVMAGPPSDKWQEQPIRPVDSAPNHPEVTGMLDDDEIEVIEAAAGETAKGLPKSDTLKFGAMPAPKPATPAAPPVQELASVPSLDKLGDAIEAKKPPRPAPVIAVQAPREPTPAPAPAPAAPAPTYAPPHAPAPSFAKRTVMGLAPVPQAQPPAPAQPQVAPSMHKQTVMGLAPVPPAAMQPVPMMQPAPVIQPIAPDPDPDSEGPTRLVDAIVPVSEPDNDAPTQIQMSPAGEPAPLPSWSAEVDEEMARPREWPATPPPRPVQYSQPSYEQYQPPKQKSALPLVLGMLGLFAVIGVAGGGALLYFKPWEKAEPKPVVSAAPAAPTETKSAVTRCTVQKDARRLASSIVVSTPSYVAPSPSSASKVAVGFAETETVGVGLMLDPATLDFEQAFKSPAGAKIVGVVPVSGKTPFVVDRENAALGMPHTISADTPFVVGFTPNGYSRAATGGQPELVWSEVARDKATEARVSSIDGVGHAVTFRTGGKVRIGWLKPDGTKKSALGTIDAGSARVGSPTIGQNGKAILVAFATKASESDPWTLQLASAKAGELPGTARALSIPAGGPGGDVIAPAIGGLSGGRWLVQWTEGGAGERTVRAVTLDEKLEPVGEPLRISTPGKEAGQGEIAVSGENAAALHLVKADNKYELWATALSCK
jgi:hypothetical protein